MRNKKNHPGQSLVEFALVLPLLLMLVLGAMDVGRLFYYKMALTNAAREGANYLAYYPPKENLSPSQLPVSERLKRTYEAIEAEGENFGIDIVTDDEVDILLEGCTSITNCLSGDRVGIKITKEIDLIFDDILQSLGLISGPITVTSVIYMVVQ